MKAVCVQLLPQVGLGTDIVVRALPASVDVTWATLQEEITRAVTRGSQRS
jgi:ribonuclease P protein component